MWGHARLRVALTPTDASDTPVQCRWCTVQRLGALRTRPPGQHSAGTHAQPGWLPSRPSPRRHDAPLAAAPRLGGAEAGACRRRVAPERRRNLGASDRGGTPSRAPIQQQ